ncbi:hypothetical protein AIZ09_23395, partial [Salmonella enterica subsp. enterica serovar Typhimurium]
RFFHLLRIEFADGEVFLIGMPVIGTLVCVNPIIILVRLLLAEPTKLVDIFHTGDSAREQGNSGGRER